MTTQNERAVRFRALHQGPGAFVIADAWTVARRAFSLGSASRHWRRRAARKPERSASVMAT